MVPALAIGRPPIATGPPDLSSFARMSVPRSEQRKTPRQAVVLIHGIGEQQPMATLRSFVTGLGYTKFRSKPDQFSEGFELRRLVVEKQASRVPVDFIEFYWAHHLDRGQMRQTLLWAAKLVARRPFWRHGPGLRGPIGVVQVASALILVIACWAAVSALAAGQLSPTVSGWAKTVGTVALVLNIVAGGFITSSVADAPRYLTPTSANIAGRNAIRQEGLALLRSLHESGEYQRIVLVGHSLGSVIGFDLLRLLWEELRHPDPFHPLPLTEMSRIEAAAAAARHAETDDDRDLWQRQQYRLWRECRSRGMPWLITDFVTLGSPLAHGSFLLEPSRWGRAGPGPTLKQRQHEGEIPTCPPDEGLGEIFHSAKYPVSQGKRNVMAAGHARLFAVTRWTNLYFPVSLFHGDPVGGPVAQAFGAGIRDVAVRTEPLKSRSRSALYLLAHVRYWVPDKERTPAEQQQQDEVNKESDPRTYFVAGRLRTALGLKIEDARPHYPPADPVATGWSSE